MKKLDGYGGDIGIFAESKRGWRGEDDVLRGVITRSSS
jgi:hypothetical protein